MVQFDRNATAIEKSSAFTPLDLRYSDNDDGMPTMYRPNRLRGKVADRLSVIHRTFARHRVDQWRTRHRIGPHAIVFYYVETRPDGREELAIAWRIFLDESDEDHVAEVNSEVGGVPELLLVTILGHLRDLAREYAMTAGFDPRTQLVDRSEPMQPSAEYVGLSASSVTFPNGPLSAPSMHGIALLTDGTQMLVRGGFGLDVPDVQSSHILGSGGILESRQWRWAIDGNFQGATDGIRMALPILADLHSTTFDAYQRGGVRSSRRRQ